MQFIKKIFAWWNDATLGTLFFTWRRGVLIGHDEQGNSYYEVKLRTFSNHITWNDKALPIIPGMTAQVDILTGRKTVFNYIMKPILKAKHAALRRSMAISEVVSP